MLVCEVYAKFVNEYVAVYIYIYIRCVIVIVVSKFRAAANLTNVRGQGHSAT